jgi:hypothetical protein
MSWKNDLQRWKNCISYQKRWIAKETVFSSIKRMVGEYVYSVRLESKVNEIVLKACYRTILVLLIN